MTLHANPYLGCSRADFPHSSVTAEGMHVLETRTDGRNCRMHCGIAYRTVDGRDLHLHIITPAQGRHGSERFPLVVYVQGSAWGPQTTGRELAQLARFAALGYAIGVVEYRHSEWAPFPAQVIDAKYAARWLVEHARTYAIDPSRIIWWGDSSGAHTALMAAYTRGLAGFIEEGLDEYPARCVIDFYGPIDIAKMGDEPSTQDHGSAESPEGKLIGGRPVTAESAAPTVVTRYVHPATPPTIIFHGSKDRLVPFGQSVMLFEALKTAGVQTELYQLRGADHGEEPFWTAEILGIVDAFVRANLA